MLSIFPSNSKTIIHKETDKFLGFTFNPSIVQVDGGLITSGIRYFDKIGDRIETAIFADRYETNLNWTNNASISASFSLNNNAANINNSGTITPLNTGSCRVQIDTRNGKYYSNTLSVNRATRPSMFVMKGFAPGSLGETILNSFVNAHNNKIPFPSGDINYNSSWIGVSNSDVVTINTTTEYNNIVTANTNNIAASSKIYINKSIFPNVLLKWQSAFNSFVSLHPNDIYIIQNDGVAYQGVWSNNISNTKYIVNPFSYRSFDYSGVSVSNSDSDSWSKRTKTGTLITKRHMIHVKYASYTPAIGSKVRFVSPSGQVTERTIIDRYTHPIHDFGMTLLDQDVPNDIAVYKVWSTINAGNRWPITSQPLSSPQDPSNPNGDIYIFKNNKFIRVVNNHVCSVYNIAVDQNKNAQPNNFTENRFSSGFDQEWDGTLSVQNDRPCPGSFCTKPILESLETIHNSIPVQNTHMGVPGDSGGPIFLPFNNQLILIALNSGGILPVNGVFINGINTWTSTTLNDIINLLGPNGYTISEPDIESFPNYTN